MTRFPVLDPLDRRLDVAAALRAGGVSAAVPARPMRIASPVADLRPEPRTARSLDAQLLHGDAVEVHGESGDWACVRALFDGYVGWVHRETLGEPVEPTHVVCAQRTFAYPGPDLKLPAIRALSIGSRIAVTGETETRKTLYRSTSDGAWLVAGHIRPVSEVSTDYVAVAEGLVGTPYLWGGGSAFGLDCSGFVQLAMRMCGRIVARDSDMQAASIGRPIDPGPDYRNLRRGDLVFWKGHVAIATGGGALVHANGASMDVRIEPVADAIARIARAFAEPIGCRRP